MLLHATHEKCCEYIVHCWSCLASGSVWGSLSPIPEPKRSGIDSRPCTSVEY